MSDLTTEVRDCLDGKSIPLAYNAAVVALLAVLDKCEQMRVENPRVPMHQIPADFFAAEFEQTIARALGINS